MKHSFYAACILVFLNFSGCIQGAAVTSGEERTKFEMAIIDTLDYLRSAGSLKDFGERFRRLSNQPLFSNWQNRQALLTELLKSKFSNGMGQVAGLCEAELSLNLPDEKDALEFIHTRVRDLNDANTDIKNFMETIKKASDSQSHSIQRTIMSNVDNLFAQPKNQSQYFVYALIRALIDTTASIGRAHQDQYLTDLEAILIYLRDLKIKYFFINDPLMRQWITKTITNIKGRQIFLKGVRSNFQTLYNAIPPEQLYFKLMRRFKGFEWDRDWNTIRPVIEELLENKNYDKNLMIIFTLESARTQAIIKGLSDEWINRQVQEIPPIRQALTTVENVCHTVETIDEDTHEMLSCMPILRTKLGSILQEYALNIPFIYELIKNILQNPKFTIQLNALCLGTIADYYSEHNLWNQLQFTEIGVENPETINFGHWIKEQIDQIDPIAWLEKVRPSVFANLPVPLLLFKDAIRSLFTISALQHGLDMASKDTYGREQYATKKELINASQSALFKSMRIIAIGRALGFTYRLYLTGLPDIRTMKTFYDTQPYFYVTDPDKRDPYWTKSLANAVTWSKPPEIDVDMMVHLVLHYKIHLMPKEQEAEKCFVDLMNEIRKDKELQDKIMAFKILCSPERILKADEAPRIAIYIVGKYKAQAVLNKIVQLFGPGGQHYYEGCGRAPAFNQRVTDLIFFAQGDRDVKLVKKYGRFFEPPDKIYYVPTILLDGKEHNFRLRIPVV